MSGTWTGWLRRLRGGQRAAGKEAGTHDPEPESGAPDPESASGERNDESDQEAFPAAGAPSPEPEAVIPDETEDAAPESQPEAVTESKAGSSEARTPLQLLKSGLIADARAADPASPDYAAAAFWAEAIGAGEAVLASAGLPANAVTLHGIMLAPAEGSDQLLLVMGDDQGRFCIPSALQRAGRPHVLFLQDSQQCLAMLGVKRLGESYDDCLLAIMRLARVLGAGRLYCMGGGQAMYAALRYGLDLGADGVLAAGNLTRLSPDRDLPGKRSAHNHQRLMALAAELGSDLVAAYENATERPSIVFCQPKPEEDEAAGGLATLKRVTLISAPEAARRNPLAWADIGRKLDGMLDALLASKPFRARPEPATRQARPAAGKGKGRKRAAP